MKRLTIYFLFFLMLSCNSNTEQYYYLTEEEAIDVGYPYGSTIYKSLKKYSYNNILITSDILEFKENSEFVVCQQEVNEELLKQWIKDGIKSFIESKAYSGERNELKFYDCILVDTILLKYESTDSSINYLTNIVLESPSIKKIRNASINYWIVKKSVDSLMGPLTKPEFETACQELNIPDKLKLH